MSITSPDFRLPTVYATKVIDELSSGVTRPLLVIGCETATGEEGEWVCKCKAGEGMDESAFLRELVASFIAMEWGIPVPQPAVIEISDELVETQRGQKWFPLLQGSVGLNFGCAYERNFKNLAVPIKFNNYEEDFAQSIFVFDALLLNADRGQNPQKQNLLSNGQQLMVIDHEKAFGFVFDIFPNATPWQFNEMDKNMLRQHILYQILRHQPLREEQIRVNLQRLDNRFWNAAQNNIPIKWQTNQWQRIQQHIQSICAHTDEFIVQLKNIIA